MEAVPEISSTRTPAKSSRSPREKALPYSFASLRVFKLEMGESGTVITIRLFRPYPIQQPARHRSWRRCAGLEVLFHKALLALGFGNRPEIQAIAENVSLYGSSKNAFPVLLHADDRPALG